MSAFSPRHESSSRSWWSIPKSTSNPSFHSEKSSSRDPSSKNSGGSKFNTIASVASVIGLSKSKKHPSLTIQSPPPAILTAKPHGEPSHSSYATPVYTNRPPSKSVSSTKSRVESIEPKTPSDPRDSGSRRHSLLTLSDSDPFAARNFVSLPSPEDPNRLSAYSGSSIPDYSQPRKLEGHHQIQFNRSSYASSSSQPNSNYAEDISVSSGPSWVTDLPHHPLKRKPNGNHLSGDHLHEPAWDDFLDPTGMSNILKSSSSTTLTDKNRLSHPDPAHSRSNRPPMRARGMTVGTVAHRANLLQDEKELKPTSPPVPPPSSFSQRDPTSPSSPRVVVRQPSIQRMGLPATAPPSQKLPAPPRANPSTEERPTSSRRPHRDSASSILSSLSRDTGMNNQHYVPRSKARERVLMPSQTQEDGLSPKSSSQSLKRAVSQQSLKSAPSTSKTDPLAVDKAPRKQRSFHHPRIPLPPMPTPLRHAGSFTNGDGSQVVEAKRDSTSGPSTPVRKRLFSGSSMRRPSTSTSIAPEDDNRSIFSIPIETERTQRKSSTPAHPNGTSTQPLQVSSFWDEGDVPSSPQASVMDYTPKQIMSPAEMLKLEASVQEDMDVSRSRTFSITSATSLTSESEYEYAQSIASVASQSLLGSSSLRPSQPGSSATRSHSMVVNGDDVAKDIKVHARGARPSTSQGTTSVPSGSNGSHPFGSAALPSPPAEFVSLPPPPRPRRTTTSSSAASNQSVDMPPSMVALPPPPRSKSVRSTTSASSGRSASTTTPPVSATLKRSIMKKPSFLHIDDEVPKHVRTAKVPEPQQHHSRNKEKVFKHEDSFLDFARDSLDTLRSDD